MTHARQKNSPAPIAVETTYFPEGEYVTLTAYAQREGITRMTAYLRMKRGDLKTVSIGRQHLVRVK